MKIFCTIPFDNELWAVLNAEMSETGEINLDEGNSRIQVVPLEEFHFMPGGEQVIEFIFETAATGAYNIALGLFTAWLWKKIEGRKNKKLQINGKDYLIQDKGELENIINSNDGMNDGSDR